MSVTRGFVLQPTYRIERGRPVVLVYGTQESGRPFLVRDDRSVPRFWIRAADANAAAELGARVVEDDRARATMRGEPVLPVALAKPSDTPAVRDRLVAAGLATFEADVRFAVRYLVERGIRGSLAIRGTPVRRGVLDVFENPEVSPADWTPRLTTLSLDIETDPKAQHLLSVALWGAGASEVLLLTPPGWTCPESAVPFATERDLIAGLVRRIRELDPDVITGWNVVDFDLDVLGRLAEKHGVPLALGRTDEPVRLRPSRSPRAAREVNVPGRVVLDGIRLVHGAFLRFDRYTLDHVAHEVVGEGKIFHGPGRAEEILAAFRENREELVKYNRSDARLVVEILEKLHLVELAVERSRLTGMPPDRVAASIASFDFLYLSELGRRGLVAPTVSPPPDHVEIGSGGHVLEPVPGLFDNVLVFDFRSLYPSVIRTFQIDPLGLERAREDDDPIVAPNGAEFPDPGNSSRDPR